MFIFVDF